MSIIRIGYFDEKRRRMAREIYIFDANLSKRFKPHVNPTCAGKVHIRKAKENMDNLRLIAFDLDGTLTQHKTKLAQPNLGVLNALRAKYNCAVHDLKNLTQ